MERWKSLYLRVFPTVARYVARSGGTLEEAKDVFHDTLLIYFERIARHGLELRRDEAAYLYGVARHLWIKRYRDNLRLAPLDELMASYDDPHDRGPDWADEPVPDGSVGERLIRLLQGAGEKCMRLLNAFYYEKLNMDEIAIRFGFSGKRSATVQKFKCLGKVRQVVRRKSLQYEDFTA